MKKPADLPNAFGTVLGVQTDGTVNVDVAGTTYEGCLNYGGPYAPAAGESVVVLFVGRQPVLLGRKAVPPLAPPPTIVPTDSAPSGSQYRQITSFFQDTSKGDAPGYYVAYRSAPPPAPTTTATAFAPTGGGAWDEVNNWAPGDVIQGQVSGFAHPRKGLWFYPPITTSATVTGLSITVHRKTGSGSGGNVSLRFYLHNYTAAPGGEPSLAEFADGGGTFALSPGVSGTFVLPTAWGALLASGARTGVAVYSTSFQDYGRFDADAGSGALNFSYAV